MRGRGISREERLRRAIDGGRRMAFRRERPTYHLRRVDGGYRIIELELLVEADDPATALDVARRTIAELLEAPAELFSVEIERPA